MHQGIVWTNWREGKISDAAAGRDIVMSKDPRAPAILQAFDTLCKRRRMLDQQDQIVEVQRKLRDRQAAFRQHDITSKWLLQFDKKNYGILSRFKILAVVGSSEAGKTSYGMSILGAERSLKVGCGSCPTGVLPSLSQFDRTKHKAIVFDECTVQQILTNREFFQSSQYPQTMSQSVCNQHSYEIWVYMTAMIVCCNDLATTVDQGLSESEADWMQTNVTLVRLPHGEKWFLQP